MVCRFVRSVVACRFATPRTPPLWQRDFFLVNWSVLRCLLASERSGVVKTFRCVPLASPAPVFQMPSLQLGSDRSLPIFQSSLESFDGAAFVDLAPISALSLKNQSAELQGLAEQLSGGLSNFLEHIEIDPAFFHGIPCVSAALWHPAFMCREWIDIMDNLLGNSSFPDTWSIHCGIQTLDTPADDYDLEADAPIIDFSFLFNRRSGLVVDEISIADFQARFQESGVVPLSFN